VCSPCQPVVAGLYDCDMQFKKRLFKKNTAQGNKTIYFQHNTKGDAYLIVISTLYS